MPDAKQNPATAAAKDNPAIELILDVCRRLNVEPKTVRPPYDCPEGVSLSIRTSLTYVETHATQLVMCPVCGTTINGDKRTVSRHECTKQHRQRLAVVLKVDESELIRESRCPHCSAECVPCMST